MGLKGFMTSLVVGLMASTVIANPLPGTTTHKKRNCVKRCFNGPETRSCWTPGWDIHTNFEEHVPITDVVRTYHLSITNITSFDGADGIAKPAMLINGQFPGPTIEADWGDEVEVHVTNNLQHNGTSIHWHGIWQKFTNTMDGVNGCTECPIPPGATRTYRFLMRQYGTGWYHSHFSAQYGNGVVGMLKVNGPASANYDIDLGPYSVTDWYYETADRLERAAQFSDHGPPPDSDNVLFNGTHVNAEGGGRYARTALTPGKKHLLRLVNPSVDNTFTLSLVGHKFTVIAADFVPIEPVEKDSLFMTTGQRYDVIIEADQDVGNYWFNATLASSGMCGTSVVDYPAAIFSYEGAPEDELPTDPGTPVYAGCDDETGLVPVVKKSAPVDDFLAHKNYLDVAVEVQPYNDERSVYRWKINDSSIDIEWGKPILQYVREGNYSWPREANVIEVEEADVWTWWIIENGSGMPHPMHLHGHDTMLLGVGPGEFNAANHTSLLNFDNPTRRDVVQMPGRSWIAIAWKTDNPGVHLLHCHIAWHVSQGLSVQFLERGPEIADTVDIDEIAPNCDAWRAYEATAVYQKHDSGL
ncbi:hypothetical protein ACRALDRAFT_2025823 [Sodiomyces alcalophilus JCM 7366]|uniref:uncharacterized protein n=1 Tax=Sodiomyces alcalophilus JCM 7366 TaxID=591952 RepID=UPI0039B641B3